MIQHLIQQGTISETIFILLNVKANENKALEIIQTTNLDLTKYDDGNITNVGIIAQTEVINNSVKQFLHTRFQ